MTNEAVSIGQPTGRLLLWASRLWGFATFLLAVSPGLFLFLLYNQYRSLLNNADKVNGLIVWLDSAGVTEEYTDTTASVIESMQEQLAAIPSWAFIIFAIVYVITCILVALICHPILKGVKKGYNVARWIGTTLAVFSVSVVFLTWLSLFELSWLPLTAMNVNHLGLIIMGCYTLGTVFVFLPDSNRYIKKQKEANREELYKKFLSTPPNEEK